ncbi:MAG: YhbY family RNA-binding protein [Clostridia bacterium]|nr:YhbY family RNA-binding protein [Clostridia bacterium]MBR2966679.1 YhbY family RNA-binding protein [Clostridia bacterium]
MITTKQRSKLKGLANTLRPLVTIGKEELTENVLNEIAVALFHHELVKVQCLRSCTVSAKTLCQEVCQVLDCQPVLCIGNRFVVYKFSDKEEIDHIELD